jgi:hypothetical protein
MTPMITHTIVNAMNTPGTFTVPVLEDAAPDGGDSGSWPVSRGTVVPAGGPC